MKVRKSAVGLIAVFALASCASPVDGTALPAEIDVRGFDVGRYGTKPVKAPDGDVLRGTIVEATRISGAMADSYEIDPTLKHGWGAEIDRDPAAATNSLADVAEPVLTRYGMIAGAVHTGTDLEFPAKKPSPGDFRGITTNLILFPDAESAKKAAKEIDEADFNVNPSNNRRASVPGYAESHAHYRPNVPNMGATLAEGPFVISLFLEHTSADVDVLTDMAKKTFDKQVPLLRQFKATGKENLAKAPVDGEGMIKRTLPDTAGAWPSPSAEWGTVYNRRGAVHEQDDKEKTSKLFDATQVEFVAVGQVGTVLYRTRDAAGAERLAREQFGRVYQIDADITAPKDVPGAKCFKVKSASGRPQDFRCNVVYRNYAAQVRADNENDVRQKGAAQYALLANSQ